MLFRAIILLLLLLSTSAESQTDSSGRAYHDFKKVRVHKEHGRVILEDTSANTKTIICPQLPIDKLCSISREHSAAIVRSGKLYYIINRYGDCSVGFECEPAAFVSHVNSIYVRRTKKEKFGCLYDMQGKELGQISKYNYSELADNKDKNGETYIRIYNAQDKQGLVNAKGELLLECIYDNISDIQDCSCKIAIRGRIGTAYLDLVKVHPWK